MQNVLMGVASMSVASLRMPGMPVERRPEQIAKAMALIQVGGSGAAERGGRFAPGRSSIHVIPQR